MMIFKPVQVSCGDEHTACVIENGELYTWGSGDRGQLGHGNRHHKYSPTSVQFKKAMGIKKVSCGGNHTVCIEEDEGRIYSFGANENG